MDRPEHFFVGDKLTWTIITIHPNGQLIDVIGSPTISIRDKNDTVLGDVVTVVRRSVGTYDCEVLISTAVEGGQYRIQEDISLDLGSGSAPYRTSWSTFANVPERGDDDPNGPGPLPFTILVLGDSVPLPNVTVRVFQTNGSFTGYSNQTGVDGKALFQLAEGPYLFKADPVPNYETDAGTIYTVNPVNTEGTLSLVSNEVTDPTIPEELDQTGIKRVKTKHMEIEKFDPRIMQEVRDKEQSGLPTFCSSQFCIGVPKRCQ